MQHWVRTDGRSVTEVRVAQGSCKLFVSQTRYLTFGLPAEVTADMGNPMAQSRAYSQAVITQGGTTIWLAGQTAAVDDAGKALDFEGQARLLFSRFGKTLKEAGGQLSDIVTMTVFITDIRNAEQFLRIRQETFRDNFPASALIEITALVPPLALIEIQAVAVVG